MMDGSKKHMSHYKSSKTLGDGYSSTNLNKTWKSGTGNVVESRLNSGGDKAWKGKRKSGKSMMGY